MIVAGTSVAGTLVSVIAFAAPAPHSQKGPDGEIARSAQAMLDEGKKTFRFETFGSEAFWGDALQLHKAIAGEKNGGVGPGVIRAGGIPTRQDSLRRSRQMRDLPRAAALHGTGPEPA